MASANDLLRDRAVLHAIQTGRFTNTQANEVLKFLRGVDRDLVKRIAARGVDGTWTTERLNRLLKSIRKGQIESYRDLRDLLKKDLAEVVISEIDFATKGLDIAIEGLVPVTSPAATQVLSSALNRPFEGRKFTEWFSDLAANKVAAIDATIRQGVVEGETPRQIQQRVRQVAGVQQRHAQTIARTATNHTVTHSRELVYLANADVIKGIQWVSTLDTRTSEICRRRDGKVYPIAQGPRPPAHPNCRSTTTPVTKSFRQLGIPLKEIKPTTRASLTGQVSEVTTYGPWLRKQKVAIQNEALGEKRAILFRKGKLPIEAFSTPSGRKKTLIELRRDEEEAWRKAGLSDPRGFKS